MNEIRTQPGRNSSSNDTDKHTQNTWRYVWEVEERLPDWGGEEACTEEVTSEPQR